MENKETCQRPLVLIANDDGYQAQGIRLLADIVRGMDVDVLVCAPDGGRSGYACAFTAAHPLRLQCRHREPGFEVWSCDGTPVDCVKLAIDQLCGGRQPSVVLGGINHGDNSTVNNHYSGTMGVAMEGCLKYIPSAAFSSCHYDPEADLEPLRPWVRRIVGHMLERGLPRGFCLNVNFPARQSFEGVRICRMTFGRWVNEVVTRHHERGYDYHWMVGEYHNDEPEAEDTDQWALGHGYVAITPVRMDVTAYELMDELATWELEEKES